MLLTEKFEPRLPAGYCTYAYAQCKSHEETACPGVRYVNLTPDYFVEYLARER